MQGFGLAVEYLNKTTVNTLQMCTTGDEQISLKGNLRT